MSNLASSLLDVVGARSPFFFFPGLYGKGEAGMTKGSSSQAAAVLENEPKKWVVKAIVIGLNASMIFT